MSRVPFDPTLYLIACPEHCTHHSFVDTLAGAARGGITLDQALAETADLADYIGVGPVFATATKTDTEEPWGLEGIRNPRRLTGQTLVGVGGVGSENAAAVIAAGCDGIAVVTAICSSPHPETTAGDLARRIRTV